jgi:hypothetical protein
MSGVSRRQADELAALLARFDLEDVRAELLPKLRRLGVRRAKARVPP